MAANTSLRPYSRTKAKSRPRCRSVLMGIDSSFK